MAAFPLPDGVEDLTGRQQGRLTITEWAFLKNGKLHWICGCSCGATVAVWHNDLVRTRCSKSCGCQRSTNNKPNLKHGDYGSVEYQTWNRINARCRNPKFPHYERYGGRGIKVCERWSGEDGYAHFLEDMGRRPSSLHSIDRIDFDGDYCPENCRWATAKEQANNRRCTQYLTAFGKTQPMGYWATEYKIDLELLRKRIKAGWDAEKALVTPSKKQRK